MPSEHVMNLKPRSTWQDRSIPSHRCYVERHDIEGAERIAARIHALGNHFVATYPDQPAAHLTLREAYMQSYKNAWQKSDRAAIESNLRAALGAAQEARMRDLTSEIAQQAVYSLQQKLVDLKAPLTTSHVPGPPP